MIDFSYGHNKELNELKLEKYQNLICSVLTA